MLKTSQYSVERVSNLFKTTGLMWQTQAFELESSLSTLLLLTVFLKSPCKLKAVIAFSTKIMGLPQWE